MALGESVTKLRLSSNRKKIVVSTEWGYRDVPKSANGKWSTADRVWLVPFSLANFRNLVTNYEDLNASLYIDPKLQEAIQKEISRQELLSAIASNPVLSKEVGPVNFYDYQRQGANYLVNAERCLLASEMGTGKSSQALIAAKMISEQDKDDYLRTLVVSPNTIKWVWNSEIYKWLAQRSVVLLDGSREQKQAALAQIEPKQWDFIVANYESLRDLPELQKRKDIRTLIIDEAHCTKNRRALRTKAIKKVKSKYCFLLTGTPVMNSADELWSLLNIINPTEFSSYWRFLETYCVLRNNGFGIEVVSTHTDKLASDLKHYMLRHLKKDVLPELPAKTYQTIPVELSNKQLAMYRQAQEELSIVLSGGEEVSITTILAQLIRFRQIAISARMLDDQLQLKAADEPKFSAVKTIMSGANGDSFVIFSCFKKSLKLLSDYLIAQKVLTDKDICYITGDYSTEERNQAEKDFQAGRKRLLLGTIAAAGKGLTLTAADKVIFLDKDWTPAENEQAEDRLHRVGQKNNVTVYSLVAKNAIDEIMEEVLKTKKSLAQAILDTPEILEALAAA